MFYINTFIPNTSLPKKFKIHIYGDKFISLYPPLMFFFVYIFILNKTCSMMWGARGLRCDVPVRTSYSNNILLWENVNVIVLRCVSVYVYCKICIICSSSQKNKIKNKQEIFTRVEYITCKKMYLGLEKSFVWISILIIF